LIDVVIPTVAGREDSLDRLIDSCKANTAAHLDFIVVRDEPTCGRAWQRGLTLCTNPFVWLACDDLEVTRSLARSSTAPMARSNPAEAT
jgi:hypothetical protein